MAKFYEEVVLMNQIFVMDNQLTISELIKKKEQELGSSISLVDYAISLLISSVIL